MTATTKTAKTGVARRADKPKASDAVKRENRTGWAFMAPFGILFALVFILPIIWAIYSSFFRQVTTGGGAYGGGELVDKFVGLQNFQYVITSGNFWSGVGRVLIYTLIQVPLMIIIALVSGNAAAQAAFAAFTTGMWAQVFWVGAVGIGFLIPLALSFFGSKAFRTGATAFYTSGLAAICGMMCLRLFIIYAGQINSI